MTISASAGTMQVDGLRLDDIDRRAGQPAGDVEFIDADRQLLRPHEGDIGRAAEHDGAGHRLVAALLVLQIMLVAAGAADARGHAHDQPVRRLQRGAVGAHVLDAGFRIARDDVGRGQRRRRCRNPASRSGSAACRGRCPRPAAPRLRCTTSWQAALSTTLRLDRIARSRGPTWPGFPRPARPCRRCRSRGWRRSRRPPPACRYLRPRPSRMLVNRNALRSASSMPPTNCQRTSAMHFGVLVDRLVDGQQQAAPP